MTGAAGAFAQADASFPLPLAKTHAHNDYVHQRPLFEALESGAFSRLLIRVTLFSKSL